ncbi:hypothetical protein [Streptomyces sp. NPDC059076]|uniref:hypothetical protein n=1 Tax=unclassified Streptomyces TaxID=2593676 RepID=UPI00368C28BF
MNTAPRQIPRYIPLTAAAMGDLAERAADVVCPAILRQDPPPDPLAQTAWALSAGLARIAEILTADITPKQRAEAAQDLIDRLSTGLSHAHQVAADGRDDAQLAHEGRERLLDRLDHQAVTNTATLPLVRPDGTQTTVHLTTADGRGEEPEGWTLVEADGARPRLTGGEHLAVQTALDTLAVILTPHVSTEEEADFR